jgi:hypothetical protein
MARGIVLVRRVRGYALYLHSKSFVDQASMKHLNAEQKGRLLELAKEAHRQRADDLNVLSEYLQKRGRLVYEHRDYALSLTDLRTKLKEVRENYLRATKNPIH